MGLAGEVRSRLAPTDSLDEFVHGTLKSAGFIVAHGVTPTRRRARLVFTEFAGNLDDWVLAPALGKAETVSIQAEMLLAGYPHTEQSNEEAVYVWQVLAVAECSAFLIHELQDHYLDARWAVAAEPAIERMIEVVPISRAFNLCWLAVRDVASAYLKFPNSRHELGHTLYQALEQKLGKSQNEHWNLRSFNRHARCLESQLAVTFSTILGLGARYLQAVPNSRNLLHIAE
jgi:hypothetical protein